MKEGGGVERRRDAGEGVAVGASRMVTASGRSRRLQVSATCYSCHTDQGYREDTCDETSLYSSKSETACLRRGTNILPSLANRLTTSSSVILSSGASLCVEGISIGKECESKLRSGVGVGDRKSTRLNSSHRSLSRMPSSA